jgi:hypothetical protein
VTALSWTFMTLAFGALAYILAVHLPPEFFTWAVFVSVGLFVACYVQGGTAEIRRQTRRRS